jgi:AraC-like DNA-binding protein
VGGDLTVFKSVDGREEPQFVFNITGQYTAFTPFSFYGKHKVITIIFHPYGAYRLLGIGQSEFKDRNTNFFDLLSGRERILEQQFLDCQCYQQALPILETFLLRLLSEKREKPNYARIASLCRILEQRSNDVLLLKHICKETAFSKSSMERQFIEFVGVSPKYYQRMVRFKNLLSHIRQQKNTVQWTEVAYQFGYYDQAHFIKDFKIFYGKTPSAFSTNDQLMSNMVQ